MALALCEWSHGAAAIGITRSNAGLPKCRGGRNDRVHADRGDGSVAGAWTVSGLTVATSVGLLGDLWITTSLTYPNSSSDPVSIIAAYVLPGVTPATAGWITPEGGFGRGFTPQ